MDAARVSTMDDFTGENLVFLEEDRILGRQDGGDASVQAAWGSGGTDGAV
jgi:hypothetical protein